mgnify:CR=1 FL=1
MAYTNTVSIPVNKKDHQTQLPETPLFLTISATRLGVSAENVVATIDIPNNHQGIFRPDRKNSEVFFPACLETMIPIVNEIKKNAIIITQSIDLSSIMVNYLKCIIILNLLILEML